MGIVSLAIDIQIDSELTGQSFSADIELEIVVVLLFEGDTSRCDIMNFCRNVIEFGLLRTL